MELAPKNTGNDGSHTDWARPNSFSNESLEEFVSFDESNGAWSWELHARLAKSITCGEVVLWVNLNGNHSLSSLDTSSGSDVLSESTAHSLRNTVCTSTGCLLVLTKHVVREGVNPKSVALGSSCLTDRGVGDNTGSF